MKPAELIETRDAIASAFNADEFDMFLYEHFDIHREHEVPDGPFRKVVYDVLVMFEQRGLHWALIAEVAKARPLRADIHKTYRKYAQALTDEGRKTDVDESVRDAIERFGLGPRVMVQTKGISKQPSAVPGTEQGLERVVRPHFNFLNANVWRKAMFDQEGRVCRIEVDNLALGTGFLVGPDALITNFHVLRAVIEGKAKTGNVKFRFDYRELPTGTVSDGVLISLHQSDWLIDYTPFASADAEENNGGAEPTVDQLDFALVRLERAFGNEPLVAENSSSLARGWIPVPTAAPLITSEPPMPILILQHPNKQPLRLAIDTAGVLRLFENGTRVRYATNTEPGSSGSPCFDIDWKLIALHHYGDPLHDQAQFNQGIPIIKIRERLQRMGKESNLGGLPPGQ